MPDITLPRRCDRSAAAALYPELNDALCIAAACRVDASKVEQIGQAMLQILAAAAQSSGGIEIVSPSTDFIDAVGLVKLDAVLVIPGATP